MIKCLVDNTEHADIEILHEHLKRFKIKRADYYSEYYPRKDLLTGELIPFKDYEQYFSQDFINKNNLKKWIKLNPEKGKEWAIDFLRKRKEKKGLIYSPTQVELRTLFCPSMLYYNSIGNYYDICSELGFKNRFCNDKPSFIPLPKGIELIQDSREQEPLNFPYTTIIKKLDIGDYGLGFPNDKGVYIERKNLSDFCGTMSKGNKRFRNELKRAVKNDCYLVMVVESNINDALSFNYLPQTKWIKATPQFIFKQARDLIMDFPLNFQIVFADGRIDSVKKIIKIFEMGNNARKMDLQYLLESGEL